MGRRPLIVPTVLLHVALPLDVHTKLTAHLFSELEGRVPKGAYQTFLTEHLREIFAGKSLDLAPYVAGASPGAFVVKGSVEAILALKYRLEAS